jgi:hypothetical protein
VHQPVGIDVQHRSDDIGCDGFDAPAQWSAISVSGSSSASVAMISCCSDLKLLVFADIAQQREDVL